MADVSAPSTATSNAPTPKKGTKKSKSSAAKASHPPTSLMVNSAIKSLKERGGSSLQAIKKYISSTYKVDSEKLAPFIKKYIKASVTSGALVQTKGKGASGSFKLATSSVTSKKSADTVEKKAKKPSAKTAVKSKSKEPVSKAKKVTKAKKSSSVAEKKKGEAKPKPKPSPKVKKTAKSPTKKPKSPKPKSTKVKPVVKGAKKAQPKK